MISNVDYASIVVKPSANCKYALKSGAKEYKWRHDNVPRVIHWDLSAICGFEQNERWYDHVPESVLERTTVTFYRFLVYEQTMKLGLGGWIW